MGRFSKAKRKSFLIDLATVDSKKIVAPSPPEPGPTRANLGIISYVLLINRVHFDVLFIAQVNSI